MSIGLAAFWLILFVNGGRWQPGLVTLLAMTGLGLTWLWLHRLWRCSIKITLTETGLHNRRLFRAQSISYNEIYYIRREPILTLFAPGKRIRLDNGIENFEQLRGLLETRIPDLYTLRKPLPWSLFVGRNELLSGFGFGALFLAPALPATYFALTEPNSLIAGLFIGLICYALAGLFLYFAFTAALHYSFAENQIVVRTLLKWRTYPVAALELMFKDRTVYTYKGQRRIIRRVNLKFKDGHRYRITHEQMPYALDDFYDALKGHYKLVDVDSVPWHREAENIHHTSFSSGSIKKFQTYFEDESQVKVTTLTDICRWLQGCRYERDHDLFEKDDHWQHPLEFEQRRQGDCEDHALWAWRKLAELGIEAEFVVGKWHEGGHAWVLFKQNDQTYLLESTSKTNRIVKPLQEVHAAYQPSFAVDQDFETYRYGIK